MFKNLCISKVLICGTHAHLHWEYCRSSRRRPAAADRGSPTRICSDTLACSARFCSPPRRWPREASSRRSLAVECCPFRSSCRVGGGAGEREVGWLGLRFGLRWRALTVPGSCWRIRSTPAGCARCHRVERRSGPARRSSGASSRAAVGHRRTRRPTGWHHCGLCSGETREKDIIKTNVDLKSGCGLGRGKDIALANGKDCLSNEKASQDFI